MTDVQVTQPPADALMVSLAREVVANIRPLDDILKTFKMTSVQFQELAKTKRFNQLIEQHTIEWDSAGNTHERTKLKASAMIEDWLPEAHTRLHDKAENLTAKTELAKLVTRLAGMGLDRATDASAAGERITVTINLGNDTKLKFDQPLTPKVIDADALD